IGRQCDVSWAARAGQLMALETSSSLGNGVDPALAHALERVLAAVLELDPGAGDEISHRRGGKDLARARERGDPRTRVNGDPGDLVTEQLALAGVDAGAKLEPEVADGVADGESAANCTRGPVEGCEEAVPGGVHLVAT